MDDLLKDAIADAKAVRETALENAKIALEEAFTPRLQSMLSKKIQAEIDDEEEKGEEEYGDENDWDHSLSYENKFDSKDRKLNANISYGYGVEDETEKNLSKEVNVNNITHKDTQNACEACIFNNITNKNTKMRARHAFFIILPTKTPKFERSVYF